MNVLTVLCRDGWMPVHLSEGWRRLGAEVTEFFYGTHMGRTWTGEGFRQNRDINRDLLDSAQRQKAAGKLDLIFMVIYDDVLEVSTIRALKKLGVPMVNYHVDLVGQWQRVLLTGRYFDRVACAQENHWSALRRAGIRPFLMPMASNLPLPLTEKAPVSDASALGDFHGLLYLGSPWGFRTEVLSAIAKDDLPLRIYGHGWNTSSTRSYTYQPWRKTLFDLAHYAVPYLQEEGVAPLLNAVQRRLQNRQAGTVPAHQIPAEAIGGAYADADFASLVRHASINLGFTQFKGAPGEAVDERQVRLRDFEIPMAGGFYLAQDCHQLRDLYQSDVHLATWNTVGELLDKARYYLAHPMLRQRMAMAGQAYAEAHHTWGHRFSDLLKELGVKK